jgi:anti-anti-sigma factor
MAHDQPPPAAQDGDVTIEVRHHDGAVILRVVGELDLLTSQPLHESITDVLRGRPEVLVVDLDRVTFLSSRAIAVLVEANRVESTTVRMVCDDRRLLRPLRLLGLDTEFDVYPTREAALA